jgi:hypothetical protein
MLFCCIAFFAYAQGASMKFFALICLIFSFSLQAREHRLVTITTDEDKDVFVFVIESDQRNRNISKFHQDLYDQHGVLIERETFPIAAISMRSGLVLNEKEGRVVVRMTSENFESHNGGHVLIDTLYNGVTGSRRNYEYEVVRAGQTWELVQDGRPVRSIHLRSKRVLAIGTVGIAGVINF